MPSDNKLVGFRFRGVMAAQPEGRVAVYSAKLLYREKRVRNSAAPPDLFERISGSLVFKGQLAKLSRTLIGDERRIILEHRLFNIISLLNGITNIGGGFMYDPARQSFLFFWHVGSGLAFLALYWISRTKGTYRRLYWPLVGLILVFLAANILRYGGSMGGTPYYLIPGLVIATILSDQMKKTLAAFAVFLSTAVGLMAVERLRPDWIMPHATEAERFADVAMNLAFSIGFTGVLVLVLATNLDRERRKSDRLLLNVLPESIAQELRETDRVNPCYYHKATVLFTDFVGFTRIAEDLRPRELISELDFCFGIFDQIINLNRLEKIKTIGDSYMAVGGAPIVNHTSPVDAVLAALSIQSFMIEHRKSHRLSSHPYWQVRLGINTGGLVAGVVGRQKFVYDVWGDTVNTASRLESAGVPDRVNISRATYEHVKEFFECEYRGAIKVKNKGPIDMFFVNRIHPELSSDEEGRTPNPRFWEQYSNIRELTPPPLNPNCS